MGFVRILLLLCLFPWLGRAEERRVYLLSRPLTQSTAAKTITVGGISTLLQGWSVGASVGFANAIQFEPVLSGGFLLYELASGMVAIRSSVAVLNHGLAASARAASLREIQQHTGAQNLRVLTTGRSERSSLFSSTLHSNSFVFVEAPAGHPPTPFRGQEWIEISDLEETKIQLRLDLQPAIGEPPVVEVSLAELFEGRSFPPDAAAAWSEAMNEWERQNASFLDRHLFHGRLRANVAIHASLVRGAETFGLGTLAEGKGVQTVLGRSLLQRLRAVVGPRSLPLRTRTVNVGRSNNCGRLFRWFGKAVEPKL